MGVALLIFAHRHAKHAVAQDEVPPHCGSKPSGGTSSRRRSQSLRPTSWRRGRCATLPTFTAPRSSAVTTGTSRRTHRVAAWNATEAGRSHASANALRPWAPPAAYCTSTRLARHVDAAHAHTTRARERDTRLPGLAHPRFRLAAGASPNLSPQLEHSRPVLAPAGADSLERIGPAPSLAGLADGDATAAWQAAFEARFPAAKRKEATYLEATRHALRLAPSHPLDGPI